MLSQPGGSGGTISDSMVTGVVSQGPHQGSNPWAALRGLFTSPPCTAACPPSHTGHGCLALQSL